MGDVGYLDEKGRLWMCGRKSQRVETDEGTMYTEPCEAIFNVHPLVFRSALVGIPDRSGKTLPVLCVELEKENRPRTARERAALTDALLQLAQQHEHTRSINTILYHPAFPVDVRHNAKIRREVLAAWAARRLA
jgi:acyl-coenzyme A synthetase/AMP-(fatty) acid ligase